MSDYVREEIIAKLDEILARYDEDDREQEREEAWQAGYDAGLEDIYYECDCEAEERCYNPEHEVMNANRPEDFKALADAICERPL